MNRWTMLLLVACSWNNSEPLAADADDPVADDAALPSEPLAGGGQLYVMKRDQLWAAMQRPSEHPRLYNVWATWCAPCVAEMPALERFADAHEGEVELWYVNTDHPKVAARQVPRFLTEHGLDDRKHIRQHPDESDLTAAIPDFPQVLPVTYLIAPTGQIDKTWAGAVDESLLEQALRR